MKENTYPDISELLKRYDQGRLQAASLTFSEKIMIVEALRERLKPFKEARDRSDTLKLRANS